VAFPASHDAPIVAILGSMALLISSAVLFLLAHFFSSPSVPLVDTTSGAITANWSADLRAVVGSAPLGLGVGSGKLNPGSSEPRSYGLRARIVAIY
jgi:hypothetical protein